MASISPPLTADVQANVNRLKSEKLVGSGLTAEVFSWGDERVLKLFFAWVEKSKIEREFAITQAIHGAGVRLPAAFELVTIEQRHGIIFERIHGHSLLKQVERRPWTLFAAARQLADLHAAVHECCAPEQLPAQRQQIDQWIDAAEGFSHQEKETARSHAARLPAGSSLCHGDFHPGNILLTANGSVMIDWSVATRGHALADVARTSVLFESASLPAATPGHIQLLMKLSRRLLHSTYLNRYLKLRPGTMDEIEQWRVPQRMAGSAWRATRRAAIAKLGMQP